MTTRSIIIIFAATIFSCRPEEPISSDNLIESPAGQLIYSGGATIPRLIGKDSLLIYVMITSQMPYGESKHWIIYDYKNKIQYDNIYPPPVTAEIDIRNNNFIFSSGSKTTLVTSYGDTIGFTEIRNPSFNSDGTAFVYGADRSIYTYTIKDSSIRFICQTDSSTYPRYPCWVGEKIYFEEDSNGAYSHIYEVSSLGGEPNKLTFGHVKDTHPRAWEEYVTFSRLDVYPYQILVNKGKSIIYSYSGYAFYPEIHGESLFYCSITNHENGMNVYISKWR